MTIIAYILLVGVIIEIIGQPFLIGKDRGVFTPVHYITNIVCNLLIISLALNVIGII